MPKLRTTLPKGFTEFCYEHMFGLSTESIEECKQIKAAPGCYGCQKQIDYLIELAVKWVRQNPEPIKLGKVAYKR